jgi:hypothetical protein
MSNSFARGRNASFVAPTTDGVPGRGLGNSVCTDAQPKGMWTVLEEDD